MIFAEEISHPEDRGCLRFKCSSVYELNAVNLLPVYELSTVNGPSPRCKYSPTPVLVHTLTLIRLAVDQRFRSDLASDPIKLIGKFFVLVTMSPLIIVVALCLVLTPVAVFIFILRWLMTGSALLEKTARIEIRFDPHRTNTLQLALPSHFTRR